MATAIKYYVCVGGDGYTCGHHHRTYAAAVECLAGHRAGCKSQGGYSDRIIKGRDEYGNTVELDENGNEATA